MGKLLLWPLYFGGLRLRLVYDYGKTMGVHGTFYPTRCIHHRGELPICPGLRPQFGNKLYGIIIYLSVSF